MNPLSSTNTKIIQSPKDIKDFSLSVTLCSTISSKKELTNCLSSLDNPRVITWFIGPLGLKKVWLDYLRDCLLKGIRDCPKPGCIYLYNLFNWSLMRSKTEDLTQPRTSKIMNAISRLDIPDINRLNSSEFFQFLKKCNNKNFSTYLDETLWKRKWIWIKSSDKKPSGTKIEDWKGSFSLPKEIQEKDVENAYSGLQYFEGYFLIEKMIRSCLSQDTINLVFLLPNDEWTYYFDKEKSFEKDICALLKRSNLPLSKKTITVSFVPFKWTKEISERPYLCPREEGVSIKGNTLSQLGTLEKQTISPNSMGLSPLGDTDLSRWKKS